MENNGNQLEQLEFIMEGITTRMQIALEKMADSNRMMSETNKRLCGALRSVCIMMLVVVLIVVLGFIVDHQLMIRNGVQTNASEVVTDAGEGTSQAVPQFGS